MKRQPKPPARTRVTSGKALLPNGDGRTFYALRLRDLMDVHIADLGGEQNLSEFEKSLVRRIAHLTVQMEYLEQRASEKPGHVSHPDIDLYGRTANSARRLMETLGMKRRAIDITPNLPSLNEYFEDRRANG